MSPPVESYQTEHCVPADCPASGSRGPIQIYNLQYWGLIDTGLVPRKDQHDSHQPSVAICIGLSVSSGKEERHKK